MPANAVPPDTVEARTLAEAIVATINQPLLVLDRDLRVVSANRAFYDCFGVTPDESLGRRVYAIGNHQWDIPGLRNALERVLPEQRAFEGFEVDHDFERLGRRIMRLNGCMLSRDGQRPELILLVIEDVTERRQAERSLHESERRFQLVAAEVDHRAKNLLALVQAMVRMTRAETGEEFARAVSGRIKALGRVHALLAASRWQSADLQRLVRDELAPYGAAAASHLRVAGPPCALSAVAAQSLAMAVHELATNAAKYGALSTDQGRLTVTWTCDPDKQLALRWQETDGPGVHAPTQRGMGTGLIERTIRQQLGGEVRFDWNAGGLVCEIAIPASQLVRGGAAVTE